MKFTHKVAARNLLRYKKRFFHDSDPALPAARRCC